MDSSFRQSVRSLVAAVVMAAGAYSIAAPTSLGLDQGPVSPSAPRTRAEAMTRPAPRDAALHPVSRATASPGVAFASSATVDPAKASGLTMVIAAGLWIFVLVRRRWPERT